MQDAVHMVDEQELVICSDIMTYVSITQGQVLRDEQYWGRVEFAPGRGAIHLHMICIARDKVYLRAFYRL